MKMLLKPALLLLAVTLSCLCASAQDAKKTIAGTIIDSAGSPIVAATIHEKGTKNYVSSDATGQFKILVSANATLEISYTGFETVQISADNASPSITLRSKGGALEGVVVTALGIKKQKKSLGYAVQEVKGETLNDIKDPNLTNDLTGQVAGLQVVRGGTGPAGSSQIRLRGNNAISKTDISQPLIVVDGVPIGNFTGRQGVGYTNDFYNPSLDNGNGLSDINPDDIASVTVLKGPAGAALYGSLGGNGVIMVTTKSGTKQIGAGISMSSSVGFESVFTAPKTQNVYGQGSAGKFDSTSNYSWGAKMAGQQVHDYAGNAEIYAPQDNVRNYLKNGVIATESVSFQQQYKSTSIYASYSRMDDKSIIPGATLARNNITARAVTKLGAKERWTLDTKVQFSNATAKNRPMVGVGNGNNIFLTLNTFPRSYDITRFRNSVDSTGSMAWYQTGNTMNPYWASKYQLNQDTRNRYILYASLKYQFNDWLDASVTGSADLYNTNSESKLYYGSRGNKPGSYSIGNDNYYQTNYSTLITARKDNLFGKLGGAVSVGANIQSWQDQAFSASAGTLRVPNLFSINNAQGNPSFGQDFKKKAINSVYSTFEANYDGYLFLNATVRNDWSSALSKKNRSFFYPSVNLSYVFTDMIEKKGGSLPSWLSYGKLRAGYATAGSDLDPYQLYNTYTIGLDPNNNTTASAGNTLYNPDIKSQLMKSTEVGAELRFFKSLLGIDFTWYKSNVTNQIIDLPMDPLSGYSYKKVNAGNVQNSGIEISADARILTAPSANSLNWTVSLNYAHNNNIVKYITDDVKQYQLGGFDQINILAIAGQRFGQIYGTKFQRVTDKQDANYGKMILKSDGTPQGTTEDTLLGNQQARHIIGFTNKFSYKHFSLSILVDASLGGKMYSYTLSSMSTAGTGANTVVNGARDSLVVPGVVATGSGYAANTTRISPQQYWAAVGSGNTGITEANLYDASNIRIRNVQLAYSLPKSVLGATPFQKAMLSVSCNNVWLISSHMHGLDPESSYATGTPAIGFESGSAPTTRTYLVTLSLGF